MHWYCVQTHLVLLLLALLYFVDIEFWLFSFFLSSNNICSLHVSVLHFGISYNMSDFCIFFSIYFSLGVVPPFFFFFSFIYLFFSGFCHTLTWISHGYTCIPHPNPPSHLPLHLARVGCFKRTPSKHVYHQGWNRSPAQVGCMR